MSEIASYNPYHSKLDEFKVSISHDETLVGFYGTYGDKIYDSFFHSFGFIVKVRHND